MTTWIRDAGMAQGDRAHQEDDYRIVELPPKLGVGDLLLVLADGMGGKQAGGRASALAVRAFVESYDQEFAATIPERLGRTLARVNRQMAREAASDPRSLEGMGCTLLAVVLTAEGLYWVSVGDSPLWLWRQGQLYRLNRDHAYRGILAAQVSAGVISAVDAARHPDRNALISAITGADIELVDLPRRPCPLRRGDQIVLASDGLLTLSEGEIAALLADSPGNKPCRRLLAAVEARQHPHQDNVTVLWAGMAERQSPVSIGRRFRARARLLVLLALLVASSAGYWLLQRSMESVVAP